VCDADDLRHDPELRSVGFFAELDHPDAGRHEYPGLPFHDSLASGRRRPAPCFGQHTGDVLRDSLGLDDDEIDRLYEARVSATEPL
jgi:crotonobetainyl-CoA:carnitine CoA-transferase CaiB-like acyl-CoA transferase